MDLLWPRAVDPDAPTEAGFSCRDGAILRIGAGADRSKPIGSVVAEASQSPMSLATPLAPSLGKTITLPGRRKLTLLRGLGSGTAATAYRALLETDAFVRRPVVVKIFDLSSSDELEGAVLALGRAAQRAAYVVHPNAVQTYEMAVVGRGHAAVVTELVEGTTLERLVRGQARGGEAGDGGGRMPLDLALFITTEIAEALSGARMAATPEGIHAGMPHLDVSLHQVLLSFHGEVKLSDFGLAQVSLLGSRVRTIRALSKRWASVAPEVAQGRAGDARSDVFSLGILLREMLIGPRFASGLSDAEAVEHTREGFVPPTFHELQLPPAVSGIMRRALERNPSRRYSHATAMAYELRRVALSMGVGDGRVFLRNAISEQMAMAATPALGSEAHPLDGRDHDSETVEIEIADPEPSREMQDRASGLVLKMERGRKASRRSGE
jgi:serine/threonine protein kinase